VIIATAAMVGVASPLIKRKIENSTLQRSISETV